MTYSADMPEDFRVEGDVVTGNVEGPLKEDIGHEGARVS